MVRRTVALTALCAFAAALLLVGGRAVRAQDAASPTVAANPPGPSANNQYPVSINQGTCQQPVAQSAADIGSGGQPVDNNNQIIPAQGVQSGPPLLQAAASGVNFNLGDALKSGQPYVILVHKSAQEFNTYLACGELAGPVVNNILAVGLRPINNAGFAGVSTLEVSGSNTNATTYLVTDLLALSGGQTTGTPATQPTPAAASGTYPPTETPTMAPSPTPAPTNTPAVVQVTTTPAAVQVTTTPTVVSVTATAAS